MKVDLNIPTTLLTQIGVQSCLPRIARGERRADFGLNKNHSNHLKPAQNPTNIGDPNDKGVVKAAKK